MKKVKIGDKFLCIKDYSVSDEFYKDSIYIVTEVNDNRGYIKFEGHHNTWPIEIIERNVLIPIPNVKENINIIMNAIKELKSV